MGGYFSGPMSGPPTLPEGSMLFLVSDVQCVPEAFMQAFPARILPAIVGYLLPDITAGIFASTGCLGRFRAQMICGRFYPRYP